MPYARQLRHLEIPQNVRHSQALASGAARHCHLISVSEWHIIFTLYAITGVQIKLCKETTTHKDTYQCPTLTMQFDVVEMLCCHSELLGASSSPESLIIELDSEEEEDRGGAGSGTHLNEASMAQTQGVEQTCYCHPISAMSSSPYVLVIPCH